MNKLEGDKITAWAWFTGSVCFGIWHDSVAAGLFIFCAAIVLESILEGVFSKKS